MCLFSGPGIVSYNVIYVLFQGSIAIAGAAVRWLRDNLGIIKNSADIGRCSPTPMYHCNKNNCFLADGNILDYIALHI